MPQFKKRNMKHTLEYKILKFLSDRTNGKFIDISGIELATAFFKEYNI
jgi:hypothetical protein